MDLDGFFVIHVPEPESLLDIEQPSGQAELEQDRPSAGRGYALHLGWKGGAPYLVDLGGGPSVLVNGNPIAPRTPVPVQAGDEITIGSAHLTWHAAAEADRSTQVLDRPSFAETPAAEETILVPKRPAGPPGEPESLDETLVPGTKASVRPSPAASGEGRASSGGTGVDEPTLLVPRRFEGPAQPEEPGPTLIVPKGAVAPAPAEPPRDEAWFPSGSSEGAVDAFAYETVWVDMAQLVKKDTGPEFEATTILRDTQVPHLVVHLPERTWEVPLTEERMTIGRSRSNDILIEDGSLSRHHAAIEPYGDGYIVRDIESTNGVWIGKQRVQEHRLKTGDIVSLGRARLVFKGAFTSDDLTLFQAAGARDKPARRPVVFVPGMMGSELWIGSEQVWPNLKYLVSNPEIYRLPGDPRIEARNIVSDVVIVPNLVKLRQYSGLGDYLVTRLGYERGKDLLEFAYDWRQDVRLAAQRLAETIEGWDVGTPVTIVAHSLGTLVTRYYVEKLGGKRTTERIILMGGPHYGTPGGLSALLTGPGMLPMGMGDERLRSVLSTLVSAYQILPTYPSVSDQYGANIDLLNDDSWLPQHQRPLLKAARSFRRELGERSSVPAISVFGYGLKTKLHASIHRGSDGVWQKVEFTEDTAGDSSVPSGSAVLKDSEIHPVFQDHGSLYMDDDVRMRLKVELTRSTSWQRR